MTLLSVNLNKVALIRNARGTDYPQLKKVALDVVGFGADGITIHPRPDERHAKKTDVFELKEILDVELNVEGYPSEDFLKMVLEARPAQCTLVPDLPGALTSDAGWDTAKHKHFLFDTVARLKEAGIRSSIFIETDLDKIGLASEIGTDRIELYTEEYARLYAKGARQIVDAYSRSAAFAHELGLGINAGHDLNLHNLTYFYENVSPLAEVSIGHALISDALYLGFEKCIQAYQACLNK